MATTTLKHKNSDPLPNSEHAGYWPYSREQYSHSKIIFERFKSWKYRLGEVEEFFNENEKIERQLAKQYKKIAEAFQPSEDEYGGTSVYLTPIYNTAITLSKEHEDFAKVMSEKINKKIAEIKREHDTKYRYLKTRVEEAQKETDGIRTLTINSINNHEKAISSNINAKEQMDPWLTERVVVNVLEKMINHENSFQNKMSKMFNDIATFDEQTVQKLQTIFTDFSNFKISQYQTLNNHYNSLLPFVNNIQSAGPFRDFDRRYQITSNEIWTKKRTLEDFSYKINPHTIVREGPLYRTAEIRSSHWKPVWAILTDTGYLHCFNMDMDKKVIRDYTIKRQGTGSNVIEEGQKAYSDLKKPETYFSLKIGNNIKCVESTKKKAPKYTFDLVVDNTLKSRGPGDYKVAAEEIKRKKTFFGSSKKQGPNVVFTLRADTVEIYNNWVDKINAVAETATSSEAVVAIAPSGSIYSSQSISTSPSVRSSPSISASNSVAASPSVSQTDLFKTSLYETLPPEKEEAAPATEEAPEKAPEKEATTSTPATEKVPEKEAAPVEKVVDATEKSTETVTEKPSEVPAKEQEKPVAA
jgi:IS5 family transposase